LNVEGLQIFLMYSHLFFLNRQVESEPIAQNILS